MSGQPGLAFTRIEVRRSPGIQDRYALDGLCPGINIIHGPNASGKSTTAKAIHALLWPDPPCWPRGALSGQLHLDGSEWFIDFDAGAYQCQRDGQDDSRLNIGGPETRDRYILTLHDLLTADNESFAEAILRESVGGYDVDDAVRELGYRETPTRSMTSANLLKDARKSLRETERLQSELVSQQDDLAELEARRDAAREANNRANLLGRAIRVKEAELTLEDARRVVASFPPSMELLREDETSVLANLRERLSELEGRRERDLSAIVSAKEAVAMTRLEGVPIQPGLITTLRAQCQSLQDLAGNADRETRSWRDSVAQRDLARSRIADRIQEFQINEIEVAGLRRLRDLVSEFELARAQEDAQTALQDWVGEVVPPSNLDQLREGISCLNRWMKAPEAGSAQADARLVAITRIAAILVIILALMLAILAYWFLSVLVVLGVVLLFLARPTSTHTQVDRLQIIQEDYERLGLDRVDTWTSKNVEKLLDRLNDELRKGIVDEEKAHRWDNLAVKREEASMARRKLESQRDQLAEKYGLGPTTSSELYLLAENLDRWQIAEVAARQARVNLDKAVSARGDLLDKINQELSRFDYKPALEHAEVLGNIEDLSNRVQSFSDATRAVKEKQRSLAEDVVPEIEQTEQRCRAIFERLELEDGDDQVLAELMRQLDGYREAIETRKTAEYELKSAVANLGAHDEFKVRDVDGLTRELAEVNERAAEYEQLTRDVVAIETRVADAKQNHDLEKAIAAEIEASDALVAERDDAYRLAAGWSLAEFIRQQTRDRDRPRVFHRARELFSRITYGRYRLEFASEPSPRFRATDTQSGQAHSLNELSSATRVQLLMAVRIAFVEEMEQGPKLPLILDEVLGNSDEHRARAIIDATIEIGRSGRQVFYFTAQHDEVGKWLTILKDVDDVSYKVIDLAVARGLADIERLPTIEISASPMTEVPAPHGMNRRDYREILGVPAIDPWAETGSIHLWHLVHDTDALYHLLSNHINTWGQLSTLIEFGGQNLFENFPGTYEHAHARAKALTATFEAWRMGRGRSVDRAVILDSGAITETFRDRVAQLLLQLNGDAEALVSALDNGSVTGFRKAAVEKLRGYFLENGYLSASTPLRIDDLRVRVVAAMADDLTAHLIDHDDIDELITSICGATSAQF